MAIDYIKVSKASGDATQAQALTAYVTTVAAALQQGQKIVGMMNHMHNGVDFTLIETVYGLPTGKGQAVFNFVNGSIGAMLGTMTNADAKTMTDSVGG